MISQQRDDIGSAMLFEIDTELSNRDELYPQRVEEKLSDIDKLGNAGNRQTEDGDDEDLLEGVAGNNTRDNRSTSHKNYLSKEAIVE